MRRRLIRSIALSGLLITAVSAVVITDAHQSTSDPDGPDPNGTTIAQTDGPIGFGAGTTGGAGGDTVTVSSAGQLISAMSSDAPTTVRVNGTIRLSGMENVGSNTTVVGVGTSGRIVGGGGLNISGAENVIVQNLTISGSDDDNINVQYSTNVWIDHNDLSGAYDGSLDIKRASDNVTVSWNHFHDQDKNSLLGHSDDNGSEDRGRLRVTYHHNWFDGTGQRNPRVRFGNPVHVFNNYYNDIGSYGVASTMEAGVHVEANYFENVADPYHLGEGSSPDGNLTAADNYKVNSGSGETSGSGGGGGGSDCAWWVRLWFPQYCQPPSGGGGGGGVEPIPYSYTPDDAAAVRGIVTGGAGVGHVG